MKPRHAIPARRTRLRVIARIAVAASLVAGGSIAVADIALAKDRTPAPAIGTVHVRGNAHPIGTVHVIGAAAQAAARSYWSPARRATAVGAGVPGSDVAGYRASGAGPAESSTSGSGASSGALAAKRQQAAVMRAVAAQGPPRGTPKSWAFSGIPTVGALFYTKGSKNHFCTASVIRSTVGSLVVTAAHCVYSSNGYARNLEFVPGYNDGGQPYGVWPVTRVTVAKGWRKGQDPDLDVSFLNVVPPPNSVGPIQQVTGGLQIAFALPDAQHVTVIGYNDTSQKPIMCSTKSFKFRPGQMEFYCLGFWYGTSGGPWILNYNAGTGTGTVYGVIGGYQAGGHVSWASYSAALEKPAQELLAQAEASAGTASTSVSKSSGTQVTATPGVAA